MASLFVNIIRAFSRRERLLLGGVVIVCIVSGLLLALVTFNQQTLTAPDDGGSYAEGIVGQPSFISPLLAKDGTSDSELVNLLFASADAVAESIKHSSDFKTWNLRIKDGAVWHNGTPITSDDIIFTVQTIQNPDTLSPLFPDWQNIIASRVSEKEVQFDLATSYSLFENVLKNLRPVPKKLFADLSPAHLKLSPYMLEPIGSGPFLYDSLEKRGDGFITSYNLKANNVYGAIGPVPHIKNFSVKFYENNNNLVRAYNLGLVDGFGASDPSLLGDVRLNSTTLSVPTSKYYALFFNQNASGILTSKNIRTALQDAIDKKQMVREVMGSEASVEYGPIPSTLPSYNPSIESEDTYNPDQARSLIQQDGWQLSDNGTAYEKRSKNSTTTLEISITVPDVYPLNSIAKFIQNEWGAINVKTDINLVDPQQISNEIIRIRNYEVLLLGNIVSPVPDLYSFWHSSQKFYPGLNLALYSDSTADKLIEMSRVSDSRSSQRQSILDQLQQTIAGDVPAIFLVSPYYFYVHKHSIPGISINTIAFPENRFGNVSNWYVKTRRIFK